MGNKQSMHDTSKTHKHFYQKTWRGEGAGAIATVPSLNTHGRPIRMWEDNVKTDTEDFFFLEWIVFD
jgi:hypothetical protein